MAKNNNNKQKQAQDVEFAAESSVPSKQLNNQQNQQNKQNKQNQ